MEDVGAPRSSDEGSEDLLAAIERITDGPRVAAGAFGHTRRWESPPHPLLGIAATWPPRSAHPRRRPRELYRAAIALGGTVTGEHGIGATRRAFLEEQRGPEAVAVMRAIKDALDPLGILNPGRVV